MVKLLMGLKGSGKTKKLVGLVCDAVKEGNGDVVYIPYQARLIDAAAYDIGSYEFLKGLLCGIHSGNYDITHVFVDNFYKLIGDRSPEAFDSFLRWLNVFSEKENIEFVLSVSAEPETMSEYVRSHIL